MQAKRPANPSLMRQRALLLLLVILGLCMRVFFVPIHLANGEHHGLGGQVLAQAMDTGSLGERDHEHEPGPLPHPALDHMGELIAQRGTLELSSVGCLALPLAVGSFVPDLVRLDNLRELEPLLLRQGVIREHGSRGPPKAA